MKQKYDYWTDEERIKLLDTVKRVSDGKKKVDWEEVSRIMYPRQKMQCKSYYRVIAGYSNKTIQSMHITQPPPKDANSSSSSPQLSSEQKYLIEYRLLTKQQQTELYIRCSQMDISLVQKQFYPAQPLERITGLYAQSALIFSSIRAMFSQLSSENPSLNSFKTYTLQLIHDELVTFAFCLLKCNLIQQFSVPNYIIVNGQDINYKVENPGELEIKHFKSMSDAGDVQKALKVLQEEINKREIQGTQ
ncbi:Myb-like_DNA-binding domain-containing protein [Hexamita inflata]|uniref:Myb-like DNA-binding domain-containing protein n=1 Tax=Hexamita inflata TaxID=28002 RepID=A0AA86NZG8_9EUKA|nr:Myb-like DNA-binding domain-containing protein [Hexamita inflata]